MSKISGSPFVISMIMVVLLLQPFGSFAASPGATGDTGYEIPLSELKKVEKKSARPEKKRRKVSHTSRKAVPETPGDVLIPEPVSSQPDPAPKEAADDARITHDPNSYVVTGKRTVIKAVISSIEALQSARCQFRSLENGGYAFVPMTKGEGSFYTYAATLPALSEGARALRYRIIAVDIKGRVTRSREFVIPVVRSTVVPGWQLEPSQEAVKVSLETPNKALEGFEDVTVETNPKP